MYMIIVVQTLTNISAIPCCSSFMMAIIDKMLRINYLKCNRLLRDGLITLYHFSYKVGLPAVEDI